MNGYSTTSQKTSARRVTDVSQIVVAQRVFAICKAGPIVAMHFSTADGIVVVRMPATDFVEKAQRERDSNGNPFVMPLVTDLVEADAAATTPKGAPERRPIAKTNGQLL